MGSVKEGSVKDVIIKEVATPERFGVGIFEFRDDYSIFDYGRMPDTIPGKGEALARMGAWNLRRISGELGIRTHLRGFEEPNRMEVSLVQILYPQRGEIRPESRSYLVPLEVIFRNALPPGSSIFKALDRGELAPRDLGLEKRPEPGHVFEEPYLDFTTKLETSDRRLGADEAREMAGLSGEEFEKVKDIALKVNGFLTMRAKSLGIEHSDGKIELALGPDRELLVVDVCGTPDENRFLLDGFHISKQVLRDYYRKTPWYPEFESAIRALPKEQWPRPGRLPAKLVDAVSSMYRALCERWTGERVWNLSLEEAIENIKRFV
jgi:phosphoribosylaminoimidazole-succinocarboxamide synthase